jgi:hypothetical protein
MANFSIPSPGEVSKAPSELTKEEIAGLSASKRNIILYEKTIDELKAQVRYFKDLHEKEQEERRDALKRCEEYRKENQNIPALKRAKLETFVSLVAITCFMGLGGALISSYPISAGGQNTPWQFACGWSMIGFGIVTTLILRPAVWALWNKFQHLIYD